VENFYVSERWTKKHWVAALLLVSAFMCAGYFGTDDDAMTSKLSGAYFGYALCVSMLLWGAIEVEAGRIKGRRRYYEKDSGIS
tara:strand:+ start:507 stop:755 length:249 start_codon:yes stop_codon:yes gene_type:complete